VLSQSRGVFVVTTADMQTHAHAHARGAEALPQVEAETSGATGILVIGDMLVIARNSRDTVDIVQLTGAFI
jgi:hypothetical protein